MEALQRGGIQEDMVQYKLFLVQPQGSTLQQTEEHLPQLVEEILAKVAPLLIQYIWQHQSFNLKYHPEKGGVPAHIGGSTQFGDNVEDEWFIVYLLQQITEAFPDLAARVEDNDGEFLLIEAADYLPKWLNPDTMGVSRDKVPTVAEATTLLTAHREVCRASPKICSALRKRLEGYPEKIEGIAMVLAQRPDLIAPAVLAFYLRDPIDLQACRSFKTFPPDTRVLTSVTFTRCLYAQLQQQQFTPDRRSGFTLTPPSDPHYKAHELGMKLAHGFEILCSKCRLPSSEPDAPVSCNPQWKGFMESLKKNGFFREEMDGSAHYRELTRSAENFFKQSVASKSSTLSPGEEVLQLLNTCSPLNLEEMKKQESQLPPDDSDSWLDITTQDLERMLEERSGGRAQTDTACRGAEERRKEAEDDKEKEEAGYSLVAVSQGMKNFLNAMSSHEGAELPWSSSTQPFSFEPDSMASALDRLLGTTEELDSDDLDDDDDDDDDNDDDDDEEEDEVGSSGHAQMNGTDSLDGLRKYMDQMDQELMGTNIGQSFNVTNHNKAGLGNGGPHPSATDSFPTHEGMEETEEEIQPLDVDLNLVANLLESLSCQAGLAGPASNLLQSLGIHLPPNSDPS
ncbi:hypothetical protein F7725_023888 [Dissostichus mawsoni]|uniref:Ecdysoneless n=1 Tax=Dissostichus mawsoni TaxID=36200 RepID=A0A7J5XZN6_DISMA|nr:hypothetical protein F7725_023888 [Dissostichus mawsoni]